MNLKEIQDLLKLVNKLELKEFKMKDGDFEIAMKTKNYSKDSNNQAVQSVMPIQAAPMQMAAPAVIQNGGNGNGEKEAPAEATSSQDKPTEVEASNLVPVKSPIVGTFYRAPSPDKSAYVKVGDVIEVGDVVCIVEAMKLFNEIESEVRGKIVKVVTDDASPVEYDQVLFMVDPNG